MRIPPCRVRSSVKSRLVQLDLGPPHTTTPPPLRPTHTLLLLLLSWCFTATEKIRLSRDRRRGAGAGRGRLYCHYQNDSCNNISSDESHFNVSLIVRDKVTRQCPQTTTFEEKGRAEADSSRGPSAYQPYRLAKPAHGCVCCKRQHLMLEPLSGSCQDCLETC